MASVSNNIDKARAAAEALEAAYDACVAADVTFACESLRRERDDRDAVAVLVELAVKHVASLERRAMPIAIGTAITRANSELSTVTWNSSAMPKRRFSASFVTNSELVKKFALLTRSDGTARLAQLQAAYERVAALPDG